MDKLTDRGFVSIIGNKPYWISKNQLGTPNLHTWDSQQKRWVLVRDLVTADVYAYSNYQISQQAAQIYHNGNHDNPLYSKEVPEEEKGISLPKVVNNDPDFGKIKGAIIGMIREAKDSNHLINILDQAKEQIFEYVSS